MDRSQQSEGQGPEEGLDEAIDLEEVKNAIKKLKQGKAQGVDSIPNELMKFGSEELVIVLHDLINKIWTLEKIPQDWADERWSRGANIQDRRSKRHR